MSSRKNIVWSLTFAAVLLGIGWASRAEAQGRYGPRRVVVVGGFYADPFWYDPWYGAQWGPYPYPYRFANADSAVKLEVKPKQAEVYVDGYYAGIVDDFDGVFQRLHVPPGEHEISLYLDGYRAVHQKVYLTPDNTFKIKYQMERLAGGETPEPRPQPVNPLPEAEPAPGQAVPGQPYPMPPPRGPVGRRMPPPQPMPPQQAPPPPPPQGAPGGSGTPQTAYGTLSIRVQPGGAEILIDGELWRGPEGPEDQVRLVIDVAEGQHTVEIRKAGYRTYVTGVDVRRGETVPVNVSLRAQ
ncbi:MAG: PEGA domain-containing protein [Acidobacteria bacterium]|nr:PEGA domain-containing protein [Acidobacteriota bacterium]